MKKENQNLVKAVEEISNNSIMLDKALEQDLAMDGSGELGSIIYDSYQKSYEDMVKRVLTKFDVSEEEYNNHMSDVYENDYSEDKYNDYDNHKMPY